MGRREREFTRETKERIWREQKGLCDFCGSPAEKGRRHVHHINPHSWGGSNDRRNGVGLCVPCHKVADTWLFKEGLFYDDMKRRRTKP